MKDDERRVIDPAASGPKLDRAAIAVLKQQRTAYDNESLAAKTARDYVLARILEILLERK